MVNEGQADTELFSTGLVRSYVDDDPRFVERPWLAAVIGKKLADPGCRFLLLTGEPGSGKTAIMAWLARRNRDWPRYFIRRDSQVPLNSGDARSLVFALGHQLAALRPDLFHPNKLEVVVRQHVGEITAGGRTVGISVEDLEVSPFYATALLVEQEAGLVAGELAGISVGRLVMEPRLLELANLQHLALLDPAELLLREEPDVHLVILVDALDELRYQTGAESALDWLSACPVLPANVRFLLTSRPDERLLELFRARQREWLLEVAIDADPDEVEADLARYATGFTAEPDVASALATHKIAPKDFIAEAVRHADRNFQYLAAFFRGIAHSLKAFGDAKEEERSERWEELRRLLGFEDVPAGLGQLYGFFLSLIRDAVARERVEVPGRALGEVERLPAWEGLYQPVLGVLAVAYEPLSGEQIRDFGGIDADLRWVNGALARLGQFLDPHLCGHRLYHATFAEYLTAAKTRQTHPADYVDPAEWGARVGAGAVRRLRDDWITVDPYALRHAVAHLAASSKAVRGAERGKSRRTELRALVEDFEFLEAKTRELGVDALRADISLASSELPDEGVVHQLARALEREAHHLSRWCATEQPAAFAQQIHNRAVALALPELAGCARHRLEAIDAPSLLLRWRTTRESRAIVRVLTGHTRPISAVSQTNDGRVISASADGSMRIWDLRGATETKLLTGHAGAIRGVVITHDGRVVSASVDKTLRLWTLNAAAAPVVLKGHDDAVNAVAAVADHIVISASDDRTLRMWDLGTGRPYAVLRGHEDVVRHLAVTADGRRAVSASGDWRKDWKVRVWDLESASPIAVLAGHTGSVRAIAFSEDDHVVSASNDGTVRLWDLDAASTVAVLEGPRSVTAFTLLPHGILVSGSTDGTLRVWDLETAAQVALLAGHGRKVNALAVLDEYTIVSASDDRTLRIWDLNAHREIAALAGHDDAVTAVAVTTSNQVISASDDCTLRIWDLEAGTTEKGGHDEEVVGVAFAEKGDVVSASSDGTLRVWERERGDELAVLDTFAADAGFPVGVLGAGRTVSFPWYFPTEDGIEGVGLSAWRPGEEPPSMLAETGVTSVAVADDGLVVFGDEAGMVRAWDARKGRELAALSPHQSRVTTVAISSDGRIVSASEDGTVHVFDLASEHALFITHDAAVDALAVTTDGQVVFAVSGTLRTWSARTADSTTLLRLGAEVLAIFVTPSRRIVYITDDGVCHSLRLDQRGEGVTVGDHALPYRYPSKLTEIGAFAITENEHVISASVDRTLRAWDVATGDIAAILYPDTPIVAAAARGNHVAVGDSLGGVALLELVQSRGRS